MHKISAGIHIDYIGYIAVCRICRTWLLLLSGMSVVGLAAALDMCVEHRYHGIIIMLPRGIEPHTHPRLESSGV